MRRFLTLLRSSRTPHLGVCTTTIALALILFTVCPSEAQMPEFRRVANYSDGFLHAIVADDFNHDGIPDVIGGKTIGAGEYAVTALLGRGDGTLRVFADFPVSGIPLWMAEGDLNHDGNLDIMVAVQAYNGSGSNGLSVLLGNGDGSFKPEVVYGSSGNEPAQSLAVADFTGDGNLDVVLAANKTLNLFVGNGDGTFRNPAALAPKGIAFSLAAADVNSDGKPDLLATYPLSNTVAVLIGNGDGTFQPPVRYQTQVAPAQVVTGDLNNDGALDLIIAASGNGYKSGLSVLLGNGDGTFQAKTDYVIGEESFYLATGDFNGDGRLDVAITNYFTQGMAVLLGNGDGTLQSPFYYGTFLFPGPIQTADLNSDGALDLLVLDGTYLEVWLNTGQGNHNR